MPYPDIFIPSRGRATALRTPYVLPRRLQESVYVVVRYEEFDAYNDADEDRDFQFLVMPKHFKGGISETRQWIADQADGTKLIMLDDDITGINLKPISKVFGGVRKASNGEFTKCFDQLLFWLNGDYGHVSFTDRVSSARPSKWPWYDNGRISQTLFYNRVDIEAAGARFDRVPLMQDLDMNLQLLRAGYRSRTSTRWSFNHRPEDAPGGCALFRTDDLKQQAGRRMMELHPGITELKEKEKYGRTYYYMKTHWKNAFGEPEV